MNTENVDIPYPDPTVSKEKDTDVEDSLISPQRNLDDYVKVMVSLRDGARPILCW